MKIVIFQYRGKGYINLVPIVKGKIIGKRRETVYPSEYHFINEIKNALLENIKAEFK